jgi:hypothetical protein
VGKLCPPGNYNQNTYEFYLVPLFVVLKGTYETGGKRESFVILK